MKSLLLNILVLGLLASCSQLPVVVKDNHYRFENFRTNDKDPEEFVILMCFRKKPTSWSEPKQFLSGKQNLWLRAIIKGNANQYLPKEAVANFNVTLDAGKNYMANREIQQNNISLWIQEVESGVIVSDIITKELVYPTFKGNLRKKQCKTSSV